METVIGGTGPTNRSAEMLEQDRVYALKRVAFQAFFSANANSPKSIMDYMVANDVSAFEAKQWLDHIPLDAYQYLRAIPAPDGFQGLKVWPAAMIDKYIDWQLKAGNPYAVQGIDPYKDAKTRLRIQEALDIDAARKTTNPDHVTPWL